MVALGTPAELKSEIGGDVIMLEAGEPTGWPGALSSASACSLTVMDNQRAARDRERAPLRHRVVEAFPGEIEGVSVHKPSLEDVFIRRTGHRFWTDENGGEAEE